jgi:hypothetical protein
MVGWGILRRRRSRKIPTPSIFEIASNLLPSLLGWESELERAAGWGCASASDMVWV